jgi:hypothetical protein
MTHSSNLLGGMRIRHAARDHYKNWFHSCGPCRRGEGVTAKPRRIYKYIRYDVVYFDNFMTLYEYDVIFLVMSKIQK